MIMEAKPTSLLEGQLAFAQVSGVSLMVSRIPRWTPENMEAFIAASFRLTGGMTKPRANVTHFLGDTPGPTIRKTMVAVMTKLGVQAAPRTAVLTDSAVLRNMMIAWTWLTNADARSFAPKARREALLWAADGDVASVDAMENAFLACYRLIGSEAPPGAG